MDQEEKRPNQLTQFTEQNEKANEIMNTKLYSGGMHHKIDNTYLKKVEVDHIIYPWFI